MQREGFSNVAKMTDKKPGCPLRKVRHIYGTAEPLDAGEKNDDMKTKAFWSIVEWCCCP
jgi:hypothetical protein